MKFSTHMKRFSRFSIIALLAGVWGIGNVPAEEQKPTAPQRMFATPDDAIRALRTAAEAKDKAALLDIFGPQYQELATGDKVQDANNAQRFATAMAEGCNQVKEGDNKITIEVGTNNWPLPIPLVKTNGQWFFDTAAGKEEIINRHIGKDELHAIGVCRAYVIAQKQYAAMNQQLDGRPVYAEKFKSSPGTKDGLYWPAMANEPASPFGPLVAEAHSEGYGNNKKGSGPLPFHGYYFRILKRQGPAAPGGKMNYVSHGVLSGGFALEAYPEEWDQSGIMTFIVNHEGKVYQRNLGEKTARIAGGMKEYNPDGEWTPAPEDGVMSAVSEK
jgi:Protein of unknown function (DUF2950)